MWCAIKVFSIIYSECFVFSSGLNHFTRVMWAQVYVQKPSIHPQTKHTYTITYLISIEKHETGRVWVRKYSKQINQSFVKQWSRFLTEPTPNETKVPYVPDFIPPFFRKTAEMKNSYETFAVKPPADYIPKQTKGDFQMQGQFCYFFPEKSVPRTQQYTESVPPITNKSLLNIFLERAKINPTKI